MSACHEVHHRTECGNGQCLIQDVALCAAGNAAPPSLRRPLVRQSLVLPPALRSWHRLATRCYSRRVISYLGQTGADIEESVMKSIFALTVGTIAFFLAITAQGSPTTQIFLASVGLALCAVAMSSGSTRGELNASRHAKPSRPKLYRVSDRRQSSLAIDGIKGAPGRAPSLPAPERSSGSTRVRARPCGTVKENRAPRPSSGVGSEAR